MFAQHFIQSLKPLHLLGHPFYQSWMAGQLSKQQLQNYAVQYYPHVKAFPRYVSAVHSHCDDDSVSADLAHNLADEEGVLEGVNHPELWLRFAEGVGADRDSVKTTSPLPVAQSLVEGYYQMTRSSYADGLGVLLAYEYQIPEISTSKIEGLEKHYAVRSESALEFFKVHAQADVYHSQTCFRALNNLSEAKQEKALAAGLKAGQWLWDFLSEAYESPKN